MNALYIEIVDHIKMKIENKEYRKGEKIPSERSLSKQYEVSRNVVREAIGVLRNEGLIIVRPGKGAYVTKPNQILVTETIERVMKNYNTTLEDILEVREGLESSIIKNVIMQSSSEDINNLYTIYEKMEKCKGEKIEQFVKLDEEFHLHLAKYTKNPIYEILIHSFIEMTQRILFEFTKLVPESATQAQNHHFLLIKSIEQGDEMNAEKTMKAHMQLIRNEINLLKEKGII